MISACVAMLGILLVLTLDTIPDHKKLIRIPKKQSREEILLDMR